MTITPKPKTVLPCAVWSSASSATAIDEPCWPCALSRAVCVCVSVSGLNASAIVHGPYTSLLAVHRPSCRGCICPPIRPFAPAGRLGRESDGSCLDSIQWFPFLQEQKEQLERESRTPYLRTSCQWNEKKGTKIVEVSIRHN